MQVHTGQKGQSVNRDDRIAPARPVTESISIPSPGSKADPTLRMSNFCADKTERA
jgi:hypothetical protein